MSEFNSNDEIKESAFNEAAKKMSRFDKLQSLLNEININLKAFNEEYGVYNFEVKFDVINGLVMELSDKLTKTDEEECHKIRDAILIYIKANPIMERKQVNGSSRQKVIMINHNHFEPLENILRVYESNVRKLIGKAGYAGRDKAGDKLF